MKRVSEGAYMAVMGFLALVLAGCRGDTGPGLDDTRPAGAARPWKDVSDADLMAGIRQTKGEALVGFKETESDHGLDTRGRRVVSRATEASALGQLGLAPISWTPRLSG
jgi:hypothetical protein